MDLNAACSGFVYGLIVADGLRRAGMRRVLLIGAETMSRIVDWDDRGTAILFGDGAGPVVLERGTGPAPILGRDVGSAGSLRHTRHAETSSTLELDGPEVFRRAGRAIVVSARAAPEHAPVSAGDIDMCVTHS